MVIWSPSGTPETYFETGSSRSSRPSWASWTITAAVIVLVFEAIRKWVSARGGTVAPSVVVPWETVNSPWGVDRMTAAPGTSNSAAVASTAAWSAAWSIGLSAGEPFVVPSGRATICAGSCSPRAGSFCWAKVETMRPMANPTASTTWSFMIYSGSSRLSSIPSGKNLRPNSPPRQSLHFFPHCLEILDQSPFSPCGRPAKWRSTRWRMVYQSWCRLQE